MLFTTELKIEKEHLQPSNRLKRERLKKFRYNTSLKTLFINVFLSPGTTLVVSIHDNIPKNKLAS